MSAKLFFLPYNTATVNGIAQPGAQLFFYQTGTLTKLPIYTTDLLDVQLTNPVTATGAGRFPDIYLDSTQTYRLLVKDRLGTTLDDIDPYIPGTVIGMAVEPGFQITPQLFGAVADGITDDSAAFVAAIAYLKSLALIPYPGWIAKGGTRLFVPSGQYNMGTTTLDITHTLIIEGENSFVGYTSRLKWSGDCDGIRIQNYNTSGSSTVDGVQHYTGAYTTLRGLALLGPYEDNTDFTGNTEGEFHAIRAKSNYIIEDVKIDGWAGDGLFAKTSIGGGGVEEGQSNCSFVNRLRVTNVRNGVYIDGADSNAGTFIGIIGTYCRQHTIWDSSFLGNTHIGHHSANAGIVRGVPSSQVSIANNLYFVKQGQAVGASTNAPPSSIVTMTIASPGVITWNAHGLSADTAIGLSTTGALPTGLVAGTTYYVVSPTANTFQLAATVGGAAINTSGTQSGVHTASAGVDNTWWLWNGAGAVNAGLNIPLWTNGVSVREGGSYKTDSANGYNTWIGAYIEGGEAPPQFVNPTMVLGGIAGGARDFVTGGNRYSGSRCDLYALKLIPRNDASPLENGQLWTNATGDRVRARLAGVSVNIGSDGSAFAPASVAATGVVTSSGATSGLGYATGAGGAVTQATSKTTGVTLNKVSGAVTLNNAALAAAAKVSFVVTDSAVAATDTVIVSVASGGTANAYRAAVTAVAAGSFTVTVENITAGSLSEAPVINFAIIKAVAA